ncbi:heavy metal translocating P-type ATPase [Rhodopila globiformis]|uniref:Heavy metal translocating P-type ATPase n=1 Tax=Rhodopila globiformis TaxID=1071 RepID=A0A2S6MY63_RHOGL|nr:heavy metal translocating P-type ATPase metal-binding domain-containing protein [Rhodopila globiformis]PPQ27314.1 heavy metal translocating P-type ATPase [Rhodopila globiformis]
MSTAVALPPGPAEATAAACAHCGLPVAAGRRFCCPGCEAAHGIIQGLGLGRYYQQRLEAAGSRALRPEPGERRDLARHIVDRPDGGHELTLAVDGVQCGACVWLIESVLAKQPDVEVGRVNMTTRRLRLAWRGAAGEADRLVGLIESLGYRLVPFDTAALNAARDETGRMLMRCLAVAGFAAGNVMFISIAIWAGQIGRFTEIGSATETMLHWVSALLAMPAVVYAGRPFFASAWAALRQRRTNMDVPVSIGVLLVTGMSLVETIKGGPHTYFDSAVTLLFFLLVGRVLDHRARGQARATAEQLLTLRMTDVAVLQPDGTVRRCAQEQVAQDDRVLVASGERIGVDGVVESGSAQLDASLVTGESLPVNAGPGTAVYAGTLNLGAPLTVRATATGGSTLLAECLRLIEAAEARRGRFVVLADRVARRYAPAVHLAALATFLWWFFVAAVPLEQALLTATSVLIITCPCALALAVPAVQVIATGRLFRRGMLLKSPTALERLAEVDTVVFDKTGTLTEPLPALDGTQDPAVLAEAAAMAACSRHPLARSLVAAAGRVAPASGVIEHAGQGLSRVTEAGEVRLGSRAFCGGSGEATGPELWLARPGLAPVRFGFDERLRPDAAQTLDRLRAMGMTLKLVSGDRPAQVERIAAALGITDWRAGCTPVEKVALVEGWGAEGRKVLMVGDGLNDSPALAAASVSASPSTAADVSQTVADLVFQGMKLGPVAVALRTARRARAAMRQNLALSIGYNVVMVPLAVGGLVTPWLAAVAMSSSSLLVMANSLRLHRSTDA